MDLRTLLVGSLVLATYLVSFPTLNAQSVPIYYSSEENTGGNDIYTMKSDGSGKKKLTTKLEEALSSQHQPEGLS